MVFGMDYREHPGINHSLLKGFAKGSVYVRHMMENGTKETEPMRLGTLTHLMVLEPDRLADSVAIAPELNRRTKAGKEKWQEFEATSDGKLVVTKEQAFLAEAMSEAVLSHPAAAEILTDFEPEAERFWTDELFGTPCKAKLDGVRSDGLIIDLKTAMDASVSGFNRAIFNNYYHTQAAWYMNGQNHAGNPSPTGFVFIAVANTAPHEVCVVRMTDEALRIGGRIVTDWLYQYRQCVKTDNWISNPSVVDVVVPGWLDRRES